MYAELCACLFLFVCVCSHALPGDPVCQNNRSCYGGSCDCGSLYNGTYCENGASRNPVILDISCMSLLWRVCMHMHVCPLPPSAIGVPCGDEYCFNGGTCVGGTCECVGSYTGAYCQYRDCKLFKCISNH